MSKRVSKVFVLSGGAGLGAIQVGMLRAVWLDLRRGQVFPLNPLTGLLGFLGSRDHLVPDSGLRRLVTRHVERERLEQLPLPLHVIAVDVITGEELRPADRSWTRSCPARRSPACCRP